MDPCHRLLYVPGRNSAQAEVAAYSETKPGLRSAQESLRSVPAREQCTKHKSGRTIKRHLRKNVLERMRAISRSANARYASKPEQHLMGDPFARGTRYGFDQARWRGLWRMRVQEYMTCAIENMQVLIAHASKPKKAAAVRLLVVQRTVAKALDRSFGMFP